jgi:hypothetical protein
MSAVADLLDCLAEVGAKIEAAGNRLIVRAGPKPVPGELVQRLREAKAEVLAALTVGRACRGPSRSRDRVGDSFAARDLFGERLVHWFMHGRRRWHEAELIAFNECVLQWHGRHGRRWPAWQCAGCDAPIGGSIALLLADGNRVHLDGAHGLDCLLTFGERWRSEASAGLRAPGLDPSADCRLP